MPTTWSKTTDITTSYSGVVDKNTSYTKDTDIDTIWPSFGGLIHLATEGNRDLITTENEVTVCYIVVSKGPDGIIYTKVTDISTPYTKVNDI